MTNQPIVIHIESWGWHSMLMHDGLLEIGCFRFPDNLMVDVNGMFKEPYKNDVVLDICHGDKDTILCKLQAIRLEEQDAAPNIHTVILKPINKDRRRIFVHNVALEAWGQPHDYGLMRHEKIERIPYD